MVRITFSESFEKDVKRIKDSLAKEKIKKRIAKIMEYPHLGKPLRYDLKGELTVYIKPYRLVYALKHDEIVLLRFRHRAKVYK